MRQKKLGAAIFSYGLLPKRNARRVCKTQIGLLIPGCGAEFFAKKQRGSWTEFKTFFPNSPFFSSVLPLFDSRVETAVSRHEQVLLIFLLPDFFLTDLEMGSFQTYFYCGTFPKKVALFDSVLELGKLSEIVLIRVKVNFARIFIISLVDKVKTGKGCVMSSFLRNSNLL